jgi:3-(3-hydroxy-phenyl)propionate hydroxylase
VPDVLVVGAGPTGLTAALLLAARGVACEVVDRHRGIRPEPRAVHLDGVAARILRRAGVDLAAVSRPAPGLRMLDPRGRPFAEFPRAAHGPDGHPESNLFHQPDLEALLRDAVAARPEIALREGVELVGLDGARADLGGDLPMSPHGAVLGCDGAGSTVRHALGGRWRELGFRERWCVLDVRPDRPLPCWGGVEQRCDRRRPATFVPLPDGRVRFEFRLRAGETAHDVLARLGPLTAAWRGPLPAGALQVERAAEYTVRAAVADRWHRGRTLLLGDAAHVTPPFVGQGLGAGLRDADALAWRLAAVLGGADEALLEDYPREREPDVRAAVRAAVRVGRALAHPLAARVLRVPAVRRRAERDLTVRRPPGPRLDAPRDRSDPVGTTCPLVSVGGRPVDDLLGHGPLLLTTGPARPGVRTVEVGPDDRAARAWLAAAGVAAVVLRPDGVVVASVPGQAPRSSAA